MDGKDSVESVHAKRSSRATERELNIGSRRNAEKGFAREMKQNKKEEVEEIDRHTKTE